MPSMVSNPRVFQMGRVVIKKMNHKVLFIFAEFQIPLNCSVGRLKLGYPAILHQSLLF